MEGHFGEARQSGRKRAYCQCENASRPQLTMNLLFAGATFAIGMGIWRIINKVDAGVVAISQHYETLAHRVAEIERRAHALPVPTSDDLKGQAKDALQMLKERYLGK
jgi:demethoxyubiquinone hydroxylase (CLK1/Coq7/Cat5 family)